MRKASLNITASICSEAPANFTCRAFSHFQSDFYPQLLLAYHQTPRWFVVRDDNERVLATWLFFETPSNYLSPPKNILSRCLDVHLQAHHGPTLSTDLNAAERRAVLTELIAEVRRYIKKINPLSTTILLNPFLDDEQNSLWSELAVASGFRVYPSYTYAVRLASTVDEMFKKVKGDRRTKVRKAEREGITFEEGQGVEHIRHYYDLRCQTTFRNSHQNVPWEHFEDTWRAMENTGVAKVFLAKQGERYGAGQMAFVYNGYVHLTGVSLADWTLSEKIPANDYLQWHVLKWALETGQDVVDFVGAQPGSNDPKLKSIDQFKSRWGTELYESLRLEMPGNKFKTLVAAAMRRFIS